jgi:hypothetical protein
MKYLRTYTAPDGTSRMESAEISTVAVQPYPDAAKIDMGVLGDGARALYARVPAGWAPGWHPAPRRRYSVTLSGAAEIETADGKRQVLRQGDIALFDDTTGGGHHTRVLDGAAWETFVIDL